MKEGGDDRRPDERGDGQDVDPEAPLLERGEEHGPGLEPDGVDEKDQADDVDVLRQIQARIERAAADPDEQDGRDAEIESEEADLPRRKPAPMTKNRRKMGFSARKLMKGVMFIYSGPIR